MIEFIKSSNNWLDIKNACRTTTGKESLDNCEVDSDWKYKLLLADINIEQTNSLGYREVNPICVNSCKAINAATTALIN